MIRTLTIAALAAVSLAGTAQAGRSHRHAPADTAFVDVSAQPERAPQTAPAPEPRADFGSFSAANTAHNLGY